jgi:hypothetical protein
MITTGLLLILWPVIVFPLAVFVGRFIKAGADDDE